MKKISNIKGLKSVCVLLMVTAVPWMLSCGGHKDEPDVVFEPQDVDDVEYLQTSLVPVDINGTFLGRTCGIPLDSSDSTVLSVAIPDTEAAVELARSLFYCPDRLTTTDGRTYTYVLRHKDGSSCGTATLTFIGEGNLMARMTVSPSSLLKYVSELQFLSKWPDNGSSPYPLGYIRTRNDITYVCLREAKAGQLGVFVGNGSTKTITSRVETEYLARIINTSSETRRLYENCTGLSIDDYILCYEDTVLVKDDGTSVADVYYCYYRISDGDLIKESDNARVDAASIYDVYTLSYSTFVDGVVHGTGFTSTNEYFPQYGGTTYDHDIFWGD